ncbi:hypothetical protein C8R43DRAFT_1028131 [Mycena crocata]|nr:hypothetical protein C8R43DRAFT_1028131 [Mycena crocata]
MTRASNLGVGAGVDTGDISSGAGTGTGTNAGPRPRAYAGFASPPASDSEGDGEDDASVQGTGRGTNAFDEFPAQTVERYTYGQPYAPSSSLEAANSTSAHANSTSAHSHTGSDDTDAEAAVPGRWGLLTPAGSVRAGWYRGGKSDSSEGKSDSQEGRYSEGGGDNGERFDAGERKIARERLHAHAQKQRQWQGKETGQEQGGVLLVAGAVGVGAMIVAAAWWGA